MEFGFPEYLVLAVALGGVIVGLFVGLSGTLAFMVASAAAAFAAKFGWAYLEPSLDATWARILATALISLVAFWVVRLIVAKTVKLVVAQPGDAIFGALAAGATAYLMLAAIAWALASLGVTDSFWHTPLLEGVFSWW